MQPASLLIYTQVKLNLGQFNKAVWVGLVCLH